MKLFNWRTDLDPIESEDSEPPPSPLLADRLRELSKLPVKDVMIPRALVSALDVDVQLRRVRRLKSQSVAHFPVYQNDLDQILGWVSKAKVIELLQTPNEDVDLRAHLNPVGFVTETATAADLADAFVKHACPFIVVRGSAGETTGLVSFAQFATLLFGVPVGESGQPQGAAMTLLRGYEL